MRNRVQIVAPVVVALSLVSSLAFAEGPAKVRGKKKSAGPKKNTPVLAIATPEPLPELPPPVVSEPAPVAPPTTTPVPAAPPPVNNDKPVAAPTASTPNAGGAGFRLGGGSGLAYVAGDMANGTEAKTAVWTLDLRAGGYVTSHVGFFAGIKVGSGVAFDCDDCKATTFQVPVVAQYAFQGSTKGFYVEGGFAAIPSLKQGNDEASVTVNGVTDLKGGVGYRFPVKSAVSKTNSDALELHLGVDYGQYKSASLKVGSESVSSDIPKGNQSDHYMVGLSIGYQLSL